MTMYPFYIAGDATMEGDGKISVVDPATGEAFATVPAASREQTEQAVAAAHGAFPAWAGASPFERGKLLRSDAINVRSAAGDIAALMTREQGKPLPEALGEVHKGAEILDYYAAEGERVYGRVIAAPDGASYRSEVIYQPIGVAAAISPWNYPIELLAWKAGGALASGCTLVAKVPTETPLCALAFARCILDAGVPAGVFSAIAGAGRTIGDMLVRHPQVRKIAFTGSTAVGRDVALAAAASFKKVSLELGGSLPMLVFGDCDLEAAVSGALRRSFRNMGQICIAVNRIYVQRAVYEEFLVRLGRAAEGLVIGNGFDEGVDLGPMCTARGLAVVQEHVRDAVEKGARLVTGGAAPEGAAFEKGLFYKPTVLADATPSMKVMAEETFGPVVGVAPFETADEAVAMANDTPYGLASIVYTSSLATAHKTAMEIRAGNVSINNPDPGVLNAPYGGWQESGIGCEHGPEGLMEYLRIKHIRTRYI
ncbi:MAG: NAD-dependent succinate-semialdehyde dehydrogenase [Oscillospiraceae bacterium]|nr:NAD-dependent succinate-semialdehyde dehydrogenase [Oscillospiraceae bacterium]